MKVENHLLNGDSIKIIDTPNKSGELRPDTIIIHYTAGPSAQSAINTFLDPTSKASAHLIIDFDGSITQMVPFNRRGWHAGSSRHRDKSKNIDRSGLNNYSVGIEIVNAGRLRKSEAAFFKKKKKLIPWRMSLKQNTAMKIQRPTGIVILKSRYLPLKKYAKC